MSKWWELIKTLIKAWLRFDEAAEAEQSQVTAKAQEQLNDWGGQIQQEVKDNDAKAHQDILDTQDIDGGRGVALDRLERLRHSNYRGKD